LKDLEGIHGTVITGNNVSTWSMIFRYIQGAWRTTHVLQHGAIGHYGSNAVGASSVHEASSVFLGFTLEAYKKPQKDRTSK